MSSSDQNRVELLGAAPGSPGSLLDQVYDPVSRQYLVPQFAPGSEWDRTQRFVRDEGLTARVSAAVIDTGVVSTHPWIARQLREAHDFTGAIPPDPEDRNGHGTLVTLLLLSLTPDLELYSLKIMDAAGYGSEEAMIAALNWVAQRQIKVVNISAGIYRKKWGLFACDGTCPICQAAARASKAGCVITAAAGNLANQTACPGTLGVSKKGTILTAEAWEEDLQSGEKRRASYSGTGTLGAPTPIARFVPVPDETLPEPSAGEAGNTG